MGESTFSVEAMIRGYHVYKDIWTAVVNEQLRCQREPYNTSDPFAVAVVKDDTTVGHVPRKISAICSLFLRKKGAILCEVTGSRRYSEDLPQGGLEIPCILKFRGNMMDIDKVSKLIESAMHSNSTQLSPPDKKRKLEPSTARMEEPQRWVQHEGIVLTIRDKKSILEGEMLNDEHVNFAQQLLKAQFSSLNGLRSTLLQSKKQPLSECSQALQIIHSRGNHWIAASTVSISDGTVRVYDSVYDTLDEDTKSIISAIFHSNHFPHIKVVVPIQKQKGGRDCGLFSIANITAVAFHLDPTTITFDQTIMRQHLVQCMEKHALMPFPTK